MTRGSFSSGSGCSIRWAGAVLAGIIFSSCSGPAPTSKPASQETGAYAGARACAGCHADIANSYALTGMGRSIGRPTGENVPATLLHRASNSSYSITSAADGAVKQRRDRDGFIDERTAVFAIGSGNHARSYLARNREGKYVELPATWYATPKNGGGFWEMSPGYERADQEDFRRVVPDECLFCHASYNQQPLQAIDCERCHGPGKAHAESSGKAAIVNPKKLSRELQLDVCMQCHLETTSSPLPNSLRRFDREVFSFRPGEPLSAYMIHFDHPRGAGHDGKFEIAHAAYRLRKSACFLKSGTMTCSTCHDPHAVRRGAEAARCQQCHAQPHHANTTCIECHMPKRRTDDAPHVAMTDHFIQRRPPGAQAPPKSYSGEVAPYYPERLTPEDEDAYLTTAQVHHGVNLDAGIARLSAAIGKLSPSRPEMYFELAKAYTKKGDEAAAARWHAAALERQKDFRPAIKGLAASLLALRQFDRAVQVLAPVKDPDARMLTNLGQALLELGRAGEATQTLERAATANPDLPEPQDLLGLAAIRRGNQQEAEAHFREALRLQPDLASANANLANILASRRDLTAARRHFEKALAAGQGNAETYRSYAFLLILQNDYVRARSAFERAAGLSPTQPHARIDLAEMELEARRPDAAAAQYRLALQTAPDFAEAHLGLGLLLLRTGKTAEARLHLEKAVQSSNPEVQSAARNALR